MIKIKICGLSRREDIETVNREKPNYCGFIINFPKSKRNIDVDTLRKLTKILNPDVMPVGVFVDQPVNFVAELLNNDTIKIAQLHGNEDNVYIKNLRGMTNKEIWQAYQVKTAKNITTAENSLSDFILLDAGQGKGKTFDWSLIKNVGRPFALAGGLNIDNLELALKTGATVLDVSGGVETGGLKDAEKISNFIRKARKLDTGLKGGR